MVVGQSSRVQYLSTNVVENIHRPSTDAASEASSFEPRGKARVSKKVSSEKTLLPNHARKKAETLRDATGPRAWTRPRSGAERSARRRPRKPQGAPGPSRGRLAQARVLVGGCGRARRRPNSLETFVYFLKAKTPCPLPLVARRAIGSAGRPSCRRCTTRSGTTASMSSLPSSG